MSQARAAHDKAGCVFGSSPVGGTLSAYLGQALFEAAERGLVDQCVSALRSGAPMEGPSPSRAPLVAAISRGHDAVIDLLICKGASVNGVPETEAPLHAAARRGLSDVCGRLIRLGARMDALNGHGLAPLHLAATLAPSETAALLISAGAEVDITTPYGLTPLLIASRHGNRDTVERLLEAGADADRRDRAGKNALDQAALAGAHGADCARSIRAALERRCLERSVTTVAPDKSIRRAQRRL